MDLGIDEEAEEEGAWPWALGDVDVEPMAAWEGADDPSDDWLDGQLARLRPEAAPDSGDPETDDAGGGAVLRHPAPARIRRRRRADPATAGDLPAPDVPGYRRDRRGTWRYAATGRAVPGARDLTLRCLYRFPTRGGAVLVPVEVVRTEAELAWCLAWRHTLTTRVDAGRVTTVLRVPAGEWERRADVPFGLWAPELSAARLLGIADVARLAGVSPATVTAYLSRGRIPAPVLRIGRSPVWSRPVIAQWLAARPGQGRRGSAGPA